MNRLRQIAAGCGATGIAAAAYAAHGLEKIASPEQVRWWAIAVALQLVTAPVLLSLSLSSRAIRPASGALLLIGLCLFSGSLYLMALGAPRFLGAVTPIGGLSLILGWLVIAWPSSKKE